MDILDLAVCSSFGGAPEEDSSNHRIVSEELRDCGLGFLFRGNLSDHGLKSVLVGRDFHAIHVEENQRSHCPGPLVPVHEWMVLDNVEEVCGSHCEQVLVQVRVPKSDERHGHRRLQETQVPDVLDAPVPLDLITVDFQDLLHLRKDGGIVYSASRLSAPAYFRFTRPSAS